MAVMPNLRTKRFRGVEKQRKTEERDFRFAQANSENSSTPRKRLLRRLGFSQLKLLN